MINPDLGLLNKGNQWLCPERGVSPNKLSYYKTPYIYCRHYDVENAAHQQNNVMVSCRVPLTKKNQKCGNRSTGHRPVRNDDAALQVSLDCAKDRDAL